MRSLNRASSLEEAKDTSLSRGNLKLVSFMSSTQVKHCLLIKQEIAQYIIQ